MTSEPSDPELRIPGPLRRNALLLSGVVAILLIGPAISRLLDNYRAVVLELRDDQMFLAWPLKPPDWVPRIEANPGDMVVKAMGRWDPLVTSPTPEDDPLVDLYRRYTSTYEGVIVQIIKPHHPGGASTAVIATEPDQKKKHVPLWSDHLAGAAVGRRVKKSSGAWDPALVIEPGE